MRAIGILAILLGLGLAFGYPLYLADYSGEEVSRQRVFERSQGGWQNGWKPVSIDLQESHSPLRIRFDGEMLPGNYNMPNTLPLGVDLNGPEGLVFSAQLKIGTDEKTTASGGQKRKIWIATPQFGILDGGPHQLEAKITEAEDMNVAWLDAIFVAKVGQPNEEYRSVGLGIAGAGLLLFIVSRRKRSKRKRSKSKRRWGRRD